MARLMVKDFLVSGEVFELREEGTPGILQTWPVPQELMRYYDSPEYISHTDGSSGIMDRLYSWAKRYNAKRKLRGLQQYCPGKGMLLDVGAGTADFVMAARQEGWQATGMEPNPKAREVALQKGVDLSADHSTTPNGPYNCITLWHVLEHIPDLDRELSWLSEQLDPEGVLVLALPNYRSWDALHYKENWAAYDVPRHLWHFSAEGIQQKMGAFGFICIGTQSMPLDAYYVSWLSEKHIGRTLAPLRGFISGMRSNGSARLTGEYSSLIYYFHKNPGMAK